MTTSTDTDQISYWLALGMFVDEFAKIETTIRHTLVAHAGVSHLGSAIFSGTRVKAAIDLIGRIRETLDLPDDEHLKRAFEQLKIINTTRDKLLHFGTQFSLPQFYVSTELQANIPQKISVFPISATIIQDMTEDLRLCHSLIVVWRLKSRSSDGRMYTDATQSNTVPDSEIVRTSAAWRYKPQQLTGEQLPEHIRRNQRYAQAKARQRRAQPPPSQK